MATEEPTKRKKTKGRKFRNILKDKKFCLHSKRKDIEMKRARLFLLLDNMTEKEKTKQNLIDKINIILSNNADYGNEDGCLISVKNFSKVAIDIIDYFNLYKNDKKD
jgi:hypothetical protein